MDCQHVRPVDDHRLKRRWTFGWNPAVLQKSTKMRVVKMATNTYDVRLPADKPDLGTNVGFLIP